MWKNHEGYHDPTAGKAIQKASRKRRTRTRTGRLMYRIGDLLPDVGRKEK